tara:strand:- start:243 stop:755 length:513 start_codon:yes stop_codon:yes gene_type:complete|eukprot:g1516.t1
MTAKTIRAAIILDSDGGRICSKYYSRELKKSEKKQRDFEKKLYAKTMNTNALMEAEVVMFGEQVVVYRNSMDCFIYIVGPNSANELVLTAVLDGLYDAISILLRGQMEKRVMFDNLSYIILALDELIDAGVILEIDPQAIANRVLMSSCDADFEGSLEGNGGGSHWSRQN